MKLKLRWHVCVLTVCIVSTSEQAESAPPPSTTNAGSLIVTQLPKSLQLDPFYQKSVSANGYPVIGSKRVSGYALKEAAYLINMMLAERPDLRKVMIASGSRMIVMAHDEFTTDIPENSVGRASGRL